MDSPTLVNRGAALPQGSRSTKGGESGRRAGLQGATSGAGAASSGTVLALLDSASRQRHLGSGQSYELKGETQSESSTATGSSAKAAGPNVDSRAEPVVQAFQQQFADNASDHDAFHALMRQTFGDSYDYAAAEKIRNQTLAGDFSWMPDVQVVDPETLSNQGGNGGGTAHGAYSGETDTIYLSSDLVEGDPDFALQIMTEEVGHGLDTRLNETDSAGDEGAIFASLMAGDHLSQEELDALRAENDHGTITVDGQEIEVEFGCSFPDPFHEAKKAVRKLVEMIPGPVGDMFVAALNAVEELADSLKEAVIKVLNSPIFNYILLICSFIPALNLVVLAIQIVKAVYMIAQGIKHGSMAMVLSGIAGLAASAAGMGAAMGAPAKFVEAATKVADWANAAAKTYQAASQKDFAAAFSILAETFSGTRAGTAFGHASRAYSAYEAVDSGDVLGAMSIGSHLLGDMTTGDTAEFFQSIDGHTETIGGIIEAVRTGDYSAAADALVANYGDNIGLSAAQQERVVEVAGALEIADSARQMIEDGNYAGAAMALYGAAEQFGIGDEAGATLLRAAETVAQLAELAMLVERGEYAEAVALGAAMLDSDPSPEMQQRVDNLVKQAERVEGVVEAIETGDYTVALGLIAEGFGQPLTDETRETLAKLETRVEAVIALVEAVEDGDVNGALAALQVATNVELPPEVARTIAMAENAVEQVERIKAAIDDGDYALAADLLGTLAAGFGDNQLAVAVGEFAATVGQLADLVTLVENGEYGEAVALGARIQDSNPSPEMQQIVARLVMQAERVEDVVEAIDAGDHTTALALIGEAAGMPLDSGTREALAHLETRVEAAVALHEAIDRGDIGGGLGALGALTGVELSGIADTVDGLERVAEQVAHIEEAIETGRYSEAAELVGDIADGLQDRQLAQALHAFAMLLEQFGPVAAGADTARAVGA